jgi:hypothetical protein
MQKQKHKVFVLGQPFKPQSHICGLNLELNLGGTQVTFMTFSIMTHSIRAFCLMTLSIGTFSLMTLSITIKKATPSLAKLSITTSSLCVVF